MEHSAGLYKEQENKCLYEGLKICGMHLSRGKEKPGLPEWPSYEALLLDDIAGSEHGMVAAWPVASSETQSPPHEAGFYEERRMLEANTKSATAKAV